MTKEVKKGMRMVASTADLLYKVNKACDGDMEKAEEGDTRSIFGKPATYTGGEWVVDTDGDGTPDTNMTDTAMVEDRMTDDGQGFKPDPEATSGAASMSDEEILEFAYDNIGDVADELAISYGEVMDPQEAKEMVADMSSKEIAIEAMGLGILDNMVDSDDEEGRKQEYTEGWARDLSNQYGGTKASSEYAVGRMIDTYGVDGFMDLDNETKTQMYNQGVLEYEYNQQQAQSDQVESQGNDPQSDIRGMIDDLDADDLEQFLDTYGGDIEGNLGEEIGRILSEQDEDDIIDTIGSFGDYEY